MFSCFLFLYIFIHLISKLLCGFVNFLVTICELLAVINNPFNSLIKNEDSIGSYLLNKGG